VIETNRGAAPHPATKAVAWPWAIALAAAIGAIHTLWMLPLATILGQKAHPRKTAR
jgi:hypothetical protein